MRPFLDANIAIPEKDTMKTALNSNTAYQNTLEDPDLSLCLEILTLVFLKLNQ